MMGPAREDASGQWRCRSWRRDAGRSSCRRWRRTSAPRSRGSCRARVAAGEEAAELHPSTRLQTAAPAQRRRQRSRRWWAGHRPKQRAPAAGAPSSQLATPLRRAVASRGIGTLQQLWRPRGQPRGRRPRRNSKRALTALVDALAPEAPPSEEAAGASKGRGSLRRARQWRQLRWRPRPRPQRPSRRGTAVLAAMWPRRPQENTSRRAGGGGAPREAFDFEAAAHPVCFFAELAVFPGGVCCSASFPVLL